MIRVYKIVSASDWATAEARGAYEGSADDQRDGFIHLSAEDQWEATAAKWFAGQPGLLLIAFDADALGPGLKWEPSRGGALFPHLYGPLPTALEIDRKPLP